MKKIRLSCTRLRPGLEVCEGYNYLNEILQAGVQPESKNRSFLFFLECFLDFCHHISCTGSHRAIGIQTQIFFILAQSSLGIILA
jgi:hypothetical protein